MTPYEMFIGHLFISMIGRCPYLRKGKTMQDKKKLIHMATRVQEALLDLKRRRYLQLSKQLTAFAGQLKEITTESRKIEMALAHQWFAATEKCCDRAYRLFNEISSSMSHTRPLTQRKGQDVPSLSTIAEELQAAEDEFGGMDINLQKNTISVVTEPITLEYTYLGPFEIKLQVGQLSQVSQNAPFDVIALEPNPASQDEAVTHPHVSNEKLCQGDGTLAIRQALGSGRVLDFFTLVTNILKTYYPGGAYVGLDEWEGTPCYDCGSIVTRDNTYRCEHCDYDYCENCSTHCRICDYGFCLSCSRECSACDNSVCKGCMGQCATCEESFCIDCLEHGICETCLQEKEQGNEEKQPENIAQLNPTEPANRIIRSETQTPQPCTPITIQPHSMGQAAVLPRQVG
jgi:hypothetical protein